MKAKAMSKYTEKIPSKFTTLRTVGDLKRALAEVPDKLPLLGHNGGAATLTWFNLGRADEHLAFNEKE